ncbi:MMPL family transporter [Rothia kristinae]|uniref:MMPL family transporter n=1 Tax=Rothia kristinae TaxID=37923 RepID=A0A7T3CJ90_9MICC|nr:MMPL family transporter [Rothia kristinae]QPT53960.1 MMPL family transporter [Rothia kristinae]
MATLLYKIGRFASRKAWLVIVIWLLALGGAIGAYSAFHTQLSTSFTLPGSETQRLQDELKEKLPDASHGTGQIVLSTDDGKAFTDQQKTEVAQALDKVSDVDGVASVINPFQSEQSLSDAKKQLDSGKQQLDEGRAQLQDAQQQVSDGRTQLQQAQQQLDEQRQKLPDDAPEQAKTALDDQQKQLDARKKELDEAAAQIQPKADELNTQQKNYERNLKLWQYSSEANSVSDDGSTALAMVQFDDPIENVSDETKSGVMDAMTSSSIDGVHENFDQNIAQTIGGLAGPGEIIGVVVALVVLLVMLGTLVAAGLPIIAALLGVGIGVLVTMSLSKVADIQQVTPMLGMMLGLAVGIDYSLFILNRHRSNLRERMELHESVGVAAGTSGNAVVFAGTTVVIALLALNVIGIPFLGVMGTTAALCVVIAVLVSVTFTPAMLGLVGTRVLNRTERTWYQGTGGKHAQRRSESEARGWAGFVTGHPVLAGLGAIVLLGVLAIPTASMRLGLPDGSTEPEDSTQYRAYQTVQEKFGAGANGFVLVVGQLPDGLDETAAQDKELAVADELKKQDDVVSVVPAGISDDRSVAVYQVTPKEGPSAQSTVDLVNRLRDLSAQTEKDEDVSLGVTGQTGGNIDVSSILAEALPKYIGIVLGLSFLVLILVFRSILVPLTATLGFLFSLLGAFGGVVAIYQWGWLGPVFGVHDPSVVLSFLPTLLVGILFGLAMDYQMFLVSGMREAYVHGADARSAVVRGYNHSARVVVAAAIIMLSVFGGFVFSELTMIRPIGFGLAFGVLLDAFVVRMTLIPALLHLLGEKAWWLPKWLDRILPNVDVEGAGLERKLEGRDEHLAQKAAQDEAQGEKQKAARA